MARGTKKGHASALGALFMILTSFMAGIAWLGIETASGATRIVVGLGAGALAVWFLLLAIRMLRVATRARD